MKTLAMALLAALLALAPTAQAQQAPPPYGAPIALESAQAVLNAALAEARRQNLPMAIAVIDGGGHLAAFARMDGTQTGSIEVALQKARSAAAFRRPTKVWEDALAGGRMAILGLPGAIPIEGGLLLVQDGRITGAIGVSGGTAAQDGQIAAAGVAGLR